MVNTYQEQHKVLVPAADFKEAMALASDPGLPWEFVPGSRRFFAGMGDTLEGAGKAFPPASTGGSVPEAEEGTPFWEITKTVLVTYAVRDYRVTRLDGEGEHVLGVSVLSYDALI